MQNTLNTEEKSKNKKKPVKQQYTKEDYMNNNQLEIFISY